MQLRFALLVLLPLIVAARMPRRNDVMIKVTAGDSAPSDLGVLWEGDATAGENFEKLAAILKPGSATIQSTFHEHSFTLRSSDFKFRVRLTIRDRERCQQSPDRRHRAHATIKARFVSNVVQLYHPRAAFCSMRSALRWHHGTMSVMRISSVRPFPAYSYKSAP